MFEVVFWQVTLNEPQSCHKFYCFRIMTIKTLLADGVINLRILFLKILRLLEFLIFRSRLFHCIMADRKKFFKKFMSCFEKKNILHTSSKVFRAFYRD